jgi:hypothetical protein
VSSNKHYGPGKGKGGDERLVIVVFKICGGSGGGTSLLPPDAGRRQDFFQKRRFLQQSLIPFAGPSTNIKQGDKKLLSLKLCN